jgi:hypothetical protein
MSLCMRWLYVVMLSGLRVTAWWLEPRDCHLNVNIVEIGYKVTVARRTRRTPTRRRCTRRGTRSYNFVPRRNFRFWCHGNVFWNGRHSNIFWNYRHGNVFETVATATKYWPSRRFNWRLKTIMEDSRRPGLYHIMLLWIAWDVYPFVVCTLWLRSSQLLGWSLTVNIKLKGALPSVATVYNMWPFGVLHATMSTKEKWSVRRVR